MVSLETTSSTPFKPTLGDESFDMGTEVKCVS
jgi:hypothetical protein